MTNLSRRDSLAFTAATLGLATFAPWRSAQAMAEQPDADQEPSERPPASDGTTWHDASSWPIEGKGWTETEKPFDRLPSKAQSLVRKPVWDLSRNSAGMMTRFATDSNEIKVRYQLSKANLAMSHMPATGVSGVDLYADNDNGDSRWVNVSRPSQQTVNATLAKGIDRLANGQPRQFSLYLPLYNGIERLEIGVSESSQWTPLGARPNPLVFYGTSIMHGACASRPGMSISAILGRRFNRSVINLGFSGNGTMDLPIASLIGELEPSVIAVDCLPNMRGPQVQQRAVPFVKALRKLKPVTPILLVEDRAFTNAEFFKSRREHHAATRAQLKQAFAQLQQEGVDRIFYLSGEHLLGDDGDGATDGSHPNDLGMMRYADAYEQALKPILAE